MTADLPRLAVYRDESDATVTVMIRAQPLLGCRGRTLVLRQADGAVRPMRNHRRVAMEIHPDEQDRNDHHGSYEPAEDRVVMGRAADHARKLETHRRVVKNRPMPADRPLGPRGAFPASVRDIASGSH